MHFQSLTHPVFLFFRSAVFRPVYLYVKLSTNLSDRFLYTPLFPYSLIICLCIEKQERDPNLDKKSDSDQNSFLLQVIDKKCMKTNSKDL